MGRIIAATLSGAVIYFVWGMLAWMVLLIHGPTVSAVPDETGLREAVIAQNLESGVYIVPFTEDPDAMSDENSEFNQRHLAGPIFSIYLSKTGMAPMGFDVIGIGFLIDVLAAALAVGLILCLGPCGNSYACRVGFVTGLGVFVAIIGHVSYWNWMHFPLDYTLAFVFDVVVGWALAGLAIAALVKPTHASEEKTHTPTVRTETEKKPEPKPVPKPAEPKKPTRNDAISLLAALQREARFLDIVKEPLADYTDAQVGAAARDVLRDCATVIDRLFQVEPILSEEDGAEVTIPSGDAAAKIRVTGNASDGTTSGTLVHHGWQASQCQLPKWTGSKEQAMVVAQAEVEAK